jgi:SAM-dependent methyltransferase
VDESRLPPILKWTFEDDIRDTLESHGVANSFPFVVCTNMIEHVPSPWLTLLSLRRALSPEGVLFVGVPMSHPVIRRTLKAATPKRIWSRWKGYLQSDHINFFTPATFDLTVESAGFRILRRYSGGVPFRNLTPSYGVACTPIPGWKLVDKDSVWKRLDDEGRVQWKSSITGGES